MRDNGTATDILLELQNITKTFGDFVALENASFNLRKGEIHALLGENGAGKSTLMNVICGLYAQDSGTILMDGTPVAITSPAEAHSLGIGMVHQHYKLVGPFTALENIQLENGYGFYHESMRRLRKRAMEVASKVGFSVDLDKRVQHMSVSEQQRVEILKILTANSRILILDEPTAVLTDNEADMMFAAMRALAADGATVVFVTHKLREALTFADRITVMRAGKIIKTVAPDEVDAASLTTMIVGETVLEAPRLSTTKGSPKVKLTDVCCVDQTGVATLRNLSFYVCAGEIYGIAGVGGNGQNDLTAVLTGLQRKTQGTIAIADREHAQDCTPRQLRDLGVVCIHSDRAMHALSNELGVVENYSISGVLRGKYGSYLNVNQRRARQDALTALKDFDVRGVRSPTQKTGLLSGGNAQKLVIAREFAETPEVVIAHSPCRGLDVRAASAVHGHLRAARDSGAAIILISEDLDEILLMADRVGVISKGSIVQEFDAPANRNEIGKAMVGHG